MSPIFRNLVKIPEETAHVLQNLVSAKGLNRSITLNYTIIQNRVQLQHLSITNYVIGIIGIIIVMFNMFVAEMSAASSTSSS